MANAGVLLLLCVLQALLLGQGLGLDASVCTEEGYFPYPNNCKQFIHCDSNKQATKLQCLDSQLFSIEHNGCVDAKKAVCAPVSLAPVTVVKTFKAPKIVLSNVTLEDQTEAAQNVTEEPQKDGNEPEKIIFEAKEEALETPEDDADEILEEEFLTAEPLEIYLTFDDGPNQGSLIVSKILGSLDVRSTFFINGWTLNDLWWQTPKQAMASIVKNGHLVGDHSVNHMKHNSPNGWATSQGAYQDVERDMKYFGLANIKAVYSFMTGKHLGYPFTRNELYLVTKAMSTYVRQPFTNNWRVHATGEEPEIIHDCWQCTTPASSAYIATEMADKFFYEQKKQVFGWDLEWVANHEDSADASARKLLKSLSAVSHQREGKVVVLTHDAGFITRQAQEALKIFVRLAWKAGHSFKTLEQY